MSWSQFTHNLLSPEGLMAEGKTELYSSFFANNYSVMLLIDPASGSIVDANQSAVNYYGYSRDELIRMNIREINVLSSGEIESEMNSARLQKRNFFYFRHRLSSGEIRDVEVFSGPVFLNGSDYLFSLIYDISQRSQAEKAIRESEDKYRKLIELSPDVIFVQSDGKFALINPAGLRLFGAETAEELIGKDVLGFVHPEDYDAIKDRIRLNNEELEEVPLRETRYQRLDGSYFWVEVAAKPIEYQGKRGALVIARDIAKRKVAEEKLNRIMTELERSNKELDQFAYVASHDLQEPLRMVQGYLGLLSRRYGDSLDSDARYFIDFAVQGAERMGRLIKDLLELSRITTQKQDLHLTNLESLVEDVLTDLSFSNKDVDTDISLGPLPSVMVNPVQMRQLFQNLISNAIKFRSGESCSIHIKAERNKDEWIISVKDNGIGIPKEFHDRIFLIFQRLHERESYPGTGIGLAVCKKIAERHGGTIWVESEPGIGSTFYFTLPAAGVEKPGF